MTTLVVHLSDDLSRQVIEHCLSELPNEGCGLLAMEGDTIVRVYPTGNDLASPTGFTIPPQDHINSLFDAESNGWRLSGAFHSHPNGSATLSDIDVNAALDPEWLYMVVGLSGEPEVRVWRVGDDWVSEIKMFKR